MSDAIALLGHLFLGNPRSLPPLCVTQGASGLPDTGQTMCHDQNGGAIPCDSASCPGQDGRYATGCPPDSRFVDNGDGTITDTCTGLTWQRDTADTNGDGQANDQDRLPWCEALAYCESLSFAGHDDWRLPNVRELQSIVDYGRSGPAIDPLFDGLSSRYWSSTTFSFLPDGPVFAWDVLIGDGFVGLDDKDQALFDTHVRAVRSGP